MILQSQSGYDMSREGRTKIIFTKRAAFAIHNMENDYNDNGFPLSYLIDDDLSRNDAETDNGLDEGRPNSKNLLRRGLSSNNDSANDLLYSDIAHSDQDSLDFDHDRLCSKNGVLATNVSEVGEEENIDFTDMAISRDDSKDLINMAFDQNDPQQQKQRKVKYASQNIKYKAREKNKSKFTPTVKFGWFDMSVGIFSIAIFFVDIGTDIELAVHYFRSSMWMYGSVTAALIVGPSLVTCFLGLHWYIIDYNKEKEVLQRLEKVGEKAKAYQTPSSIWFLRFFFTLLQLGPVIRVIEYLHCGYKSQCKNLDPRERRRYYRFMLYEDVDSCLLRLFESFLEAAPQLTWQLYIVIDFKPQEDVVGSSLRALALLSSWGSLAISLTSYHKSLRNSHEEKAKMTLKSLPFYFIWRASETGGRMLCIAMFASVFRLWILGPLVFHWAFMSGWLIILRTTFYKNKYLEKVFNIICGYVMIFCFLNLREGQTRFRFLLFYVIFYIENFFMLALWFRFTQDLGAWFHLWGFVVVLLLFVFHVAFQLLYYAFFHPTKNIKICMPCNRYIVYSSVCYEIRPRRNDVDDKVERLTIAEIVVENKQLQPEEENN